MADSEQEREQAQAMARLYWSEAQQHQHAAVGAIEAMYVLLEGGWEAKTRNPDCRLLLEGVLRDRRHPYAPEVPELVRLAADYAAEPSEEGHAALLRYLGRQVFEAVKKREGLEPTPEEDGPVRQPEPEREKALELDGEQAPQV